MQNAVVGERSRLRETDDLDRILWGVATIAEEAGLPISKTYYRLQKGDLPATKIGKTWTSTPRRIRNRIYGEA